MTGGAFLRSRRTLLDRGGLQRFLDRLGRRWRGILAGAMGVCLDGNLETRLFRHDGAENRAGRKARHQHNKTGGENGAENFIEFEGVHFGSGSGPEKVD
jgi:hypothetical protein